MNYESISYILRGKRRQKVLLCLDKPKTPKEIATQCKLSISNVSNALSELVRKGFVECLTPKAHTFKFYKLTAKGKKLTKVIKDRV